LPVRKIAARSELALGQSLIVIDNHNNVWPTTLSSFKKTPEVLNSDTLNARLALANNSEAIQKNSFIFNLAGDLTALVGGDKEVIPAFSYSAYWQSFSQQALVARPFLGLNYLDLSLIRIPEFNLYKGALVYPGADKIAVAKDSPAAQAGLLAGDVITWIDNQEINSTNDLADLIFNYKAGDKITLTYLRAGLEKEVTLKLGQLK
jgi:S1-C subfamily serine protease